MTSPTPRRTAPDKPNARKSRADSPDGLGRLRDSINDLDRRLVSLLDQRARLVVRVGRIKRDRGIPIYTPHRESQVLARVLRLNRDLGGTLPDRTVEGIFRELMSGSFRLEHPPRIGYLGPEGSHSHLAAVRHFGSSVEFEDLHSIAGVFNEVSRGHVDYGLVPIENSIGGGIAETLEALQEGAAAGAGVNVYAEVQLEVHHALLANCDPGSVARVYSKPEVFVQCRAWLDAHYPDAQLAPEASTSAAARRAAEESRMGTPARSAPKRPGRGSKRNAAAGVAAIASPLAAGIYGLNVLFDNIEDRPGNITRFYVISKHAAQPLGKDAAGRPQDKTSMLFTTPDKPGALVGVLSVFERAGINLTHIDKRPSGRTNWEYTFFIDAEGHRDDPWFAAAVAQARGHCRDLQVLGSYPRSARIL